MGYDIIIVGARVAGAVLGTLLGQAGQRVLILERARFPSDTLSTHFFRAPALQAFERMGVFDAVQRAAPHLITSCNDVDGHVFSEPVEGSDERNYYLCVRRITLDAILADRVRREPTVDLREGAVVEALIWEVGRAGWDGTHGAAARPRSTLGRAQSRRRRRHPRRVAIPRGHRAPALSAWHRQRLWHSFRRRRSSRCRGLVLGAGRHQGGSALGVNRVYNAAQPPCPERASSRQPRL